MNNRLLRDVFTSEDFAADWAFRITSGLRIPWESSEHSPNETYLGVVAEALRFIEYIEQGIEIALEEEAPPWNGDFAIPHDPRMQAYYFVRSLFFEWRVGTGMPGYREWNQAVHLCFRDFLMNGDMGDIFGAQLPKAKVELEACRDGSPTEDPALFFARFSLVGHDRRL